jgi:hypothetical protein
MCHAATGKEGFVFIFFQKLKIFEKIKTNLPSLVAACAAEQSWKNRILSRLMYIQTIVHLQNGGKCRNLS